MNEPPSVLYALSVSRGPLINLSVQPLRRCWLVIIAITALRPRQGQERFHRWSTMLCHELKSITRMLTYLSMAGARPTRHIARGGFS